MSIFDTIKSFTSDSSQLTGFASGIQNFIEQNGGLSGVKAKFEQEGLGNIIKSWISSDSNLPISAAQIEKVMGSDFVQDMAKKMGIDTEVASKKIAEMLPQLINLISPDGKLPQSMNFSDLMSVASRLFAKN